MWSVYNMQYRILIICALKFIVNFKEHGYKYVEGYTFLDSHLYD